MLEKRLESSINLKMNKSVSQGKIILKAKLERLFKGSEDPRKHYGVTIEVIELNEKDRRGFFIARKGYCGFDGPRGKFFGTRSRIDTELTSRTT